MAIRDIDNCVIKTTEGVPYIPGSSLKGKLRSHWRKKVYHYAIVAKKTAISVLFSAGK